MGRCVRICPLFCPSLWCSLSDFLSLSLSHMSTKRYTKLTIIAELLSFVTWLNHSTIELTNETNKATQMRRQLHLHLNVSIDLTAVLCRCSRKWPMWRSWWSASWQASPPRTQRCPPSWARAPSLRHATSASQLPVDDTYPDMSRQRHSWQWMTTQPCNIIVITITIPADSGWHPDMSRQRHRWQWMTTQPCNIIIITITADSGWCSPHYVTLSSKPLDDDAHTVMLRQHHTW